MKKAIALALAALTLMCAVSCGKKCGVCGKNSMGGEEIFGQFVCDNCIGDLSSFAGLE